jgi:hypothetical protein
MWAERRTIQQLLQRAEQLEQSEKKRQAKAARQKHIVEMKALAAREAQVWKQVEVLLDTGRKIASVYDEATALLKKLGQLADFKDDRDFFRRACINWPKNTPRGHPRSIAGKDAPA